MPSNSKLSVLGQKIHKIEFRKIIVYVLFVIMFVFFSLTLGNKGFLSGRNMVNILRQSALSGIVAFGITIVVAGGEIDLSVGSTVSLAAVMTAIVLRATNSIPLAVLTGIGIGVLVGAFNATVLALTPLPSFLITLGTQYIVKGLSMWISDTAALPIYNDTFSNIFGNGKVLGIPILIIWFIVFSVVTYLVIEKMPFGRRVLATGGNAIAAKYTGISKKKITFAILIIGGAFAGFTGLLYVGKMSTAHYVYGEGIEMSVIPAVVLGGTSMAGGGASIIGTLVGTILMVMLDNGITIAGLSVSQQMLIKGIVIIFASALGSIDFRQRRANRLKAPTLPGGGQS